MAQQSSAAQGPMRIFLGRLSGQAALGAGAEVGLVVPWRFPLPRNFDSLTMISFLSVFVIQEANVMYVAEVDQSNSSNPNTLQVKVKNVGSVAGTQSFTVFLLGLDQGDAIS